MRRSTSELVVGGALSGLLAGIVVSLWFLIADIIAGQPLHTPTALASALSHQALPPSWRLAAAFTVVHLGVFACLGAAAAWVLDALDLKPGLWVGILFGIVVQEFVFYTGLFLSGTPPSEIAPWQHVIGANVLSGMVLMSALDRIERRGEAGLAWPRAHPVVAQGALTGILGAVVVAVWFLVIDVVSGQPFRTPAALGSLLLFGGANPADTFDVTFGVVAAYTVVHVLAFVLAGTMFVAIAEQIERTPSMLLLAGMTAIVLEGVVVAVLALGAEWVLGALGVWTILVANVLAVAAMGGYVWNTHPMLRHRLHQPISVRV